MEQHQDRSFTEKKALVPFLKRLFIHSYRYKQWFWSFVGCIVVVAIVDAIMPLLWLHFIDDVLTPGVESMKNGGAPIIDWDGIKLFAAWFLGSGAVLVLGVFGFIHFAGLLQEQVMYDLRKEMFEKLQRLSFSYYDKSAIGWLISRITTDTDRVTELISWGFLSFVWGSLMIIGISIAMFIYNWQLAILVLVTIPVLVLVSVKIRDLILLYSRISRKINSEITASFNENINGIEVNKSTAQEQQASDRFDQLSEKMRGASFKASFYTATYMPLVISIGSVAAALVIFFGGHLSLQAAGISLGTLAAFYSYSRGIFMPIFDLTRFYAMAQGSLSAGERIFSLIDEVEAIDQGDELPAFDRIKGEIEFRDVHFAYVEDNPVLTGLNLKIKEGERIALVGPSGEGKSTIANLVGRFYEPTAGSVLIDGIDYRKRSMHSFRSQLGVILQQPHLFSGSILNNIRYGRPSADKAAVTGVLEQLGAFDLIDRLEEEVGEEGSELSSGEKQVIAFARTMIREPAILILDEATSSIDTIAEAKIQKGIAQMTSSRTSIIIAHRLSTIRDCDRILVIKKGKVIEEGRHEELMAAKGYYHGLYTNQMRASVAA